MKHFGVPGGERFQTDVVGLLCGEPQFLVRTPGPVWYGWLQTTNVLVGEGSGVKGFRCSIVERPGSKASRAEESKNHIERKAV